jgi:hypothetical protein
MDSSCSIRNFWPLQLHSRIATCGQVPEQALDALESACPEGLSMHRSTMISLRACEFICVGSLYILGKNRLEKCRGIISPNDGLISRQGSWEECVRAFANRSCHCRMGSEWYGMGAAMLVLQKTSVR